MKALLCCGQKKMDGINLTGMMHTIPHKTRKKYIGRHNIIKYNKHTSWYSTEMIACVKCF